MNSPDARPAMDQSEVIAEVVLGVEDVAALHGGQFGEVGTYLPGRRVTGVTVDETVCAVHISVRYPADVLRVAERVRSVVSALVDVPVDVTVGDLCTADADSTEGLRRELT